MTINMNDFFKSIERHCAIIKIHFPLTVPIFVASHQKGFRNKKYFQELYTKFINFNIYTNKTETFST